MMSREHQSITIRKEVSEDAAAVFHVNEQAFEQPAEARLVDALRERGAVTLSCVAVDDDTVVGHILFTPAGIVSAKSTHEVVALGPMAVVPARQRRGIGSQLVCQGLGALRGDGHGAVVVLGHREYYPRFGFSPASKFNIRCPYDVPDDVFMALELRQDALRGVTGTARYQPEFDGL